MLENAQNRDILVAALRHAAPYVRLYRRKTFVIKAGGEVFADPASTRALIEQVAILHQVGIRTVLVHGGGPQNTKDCVGKIPHPGRGANINDPKFGPVWATSHLGDETVALIGTDPEKNKDNAWKVVQEVKHVPGNLFVKTHPTSKHLWADAPQNPEKEVAESVAVWDMADLSKPKKIIYVAKDSGLPATKSIRPCTPSTARTAPRCGSRCGAARPTSRRSSSTTTRRWREKVITDPKMITPTGKFNVYNTQHDIY